MSRRVKARRWGVQVFHNLRWAPMFSLGVHVDFHTPRVDFHLPLITVAVGRIVWWSDPRLQNIDGPDDRWSGHMDDCWCREGWVVPR